MKVIAITLILSGLFIDNSFAGLAAKTINPDDSYEEDISPRRQRPKPDQRNIEDEEEQFVHKDDTFVG